MNYIDKPIIIKGVNHSGTSALVKILEILGSDSGSINNQWNENEFFLNLHKDLIKKISSKSWTKTIFDNDFLINVYEDKLDYLHFIQDALYKLDKYYINPENKIWHWKCPSSAIFEKTWNYIYPNAYNIIIEREPEKVARSLIRDNLIGNYDDAIRFCKIITKKIYDVKKQNFIIVKYADLKNEIIKIADYIPIEVDDKKVKLAKSFVKDESLIRFDKSINYNLKNIYAQGKILLTKSKNDF